MPAFLSVPHTFLHSSLPQKAFSELSDPLPAFLHTYTVRPVPCRSGPLFPSASAYPQLFSGYTPSPFQYKWLFPRSLRTSLHSHPATPPDPDNFRQIHTVCWWFLPPADLPFRLQKSPQNAGNPRFLLHILLPEALSSRPASKALILLLPQYGIPDPDRSCENTPGSQTGRSCGSL